MMMLNGDDFDDSQKQQARYDLALLSLNGDLKFMTKIIFDPLVDDRNHS